MEPRTATRKAHIYTAVGIFSAALLVRILHIHFFHSTVFFEQLIHDERFYHEQALSIAAGNWMGHKVYFMGPLYSHFLALMYLISGGSRTFAGLIQSMLGAGTCVLAYLIGGEVFSKRVGTMAAILTCFYGVLIFYDGLLLMETLVLFLNMLCLFALIRWVNTRGLGYLVVAGVCLGASALGRASVLLFGLGTLIVISLTYPLPAKRRLAAGLVFAAAVAIVITPVTIRNYRLERDLVPISANAGLNFYIGNGPGANGTFRILTGSDVAPGDMTGRFRAEIASGRQLTSAETSLWWYRQTLEYIGTHIGLFLKNLFWKVYLFWNAYEIPQIEWYSAVREYSPILSLPLVTSRYVIPLALLGMVVGMGYLRRMPMVPVYLGAQTLAISLFFVTGRYRMTILPVLAVLASYGILWLVETICARRWTTAVLSIAGLAVLFWFTSPAHLRPDADELRRWHKINLGLRHAETASGLGRAVALLDEAATEFHTDPDAHKYYGIVLRRAGSLQSSVEELQTASRLRPNDPFIYF